MKAKLLLAQCLKSTGTSIAQKCRANTCTSDREGNLTWYHQHCKYEIQLRAVRLSKIIVNAVDEDVRIREKEGSSSMTIVTTLERACRKCLFLSMNTELHIDCRTVQLRHFLIELFREETDIILFAKILSPPVLLQVPTTTVNAPNTCRRQQANTEFSQRSDQVHRNTTRRAEILD